MAFKRKDVINAAAGGMAVINSEYGKIIWNSLKTNSGCSSASISMQRLYLPSNIHGTMNKSIKTLPAAMTSI